jgi:hypothetical protein
MFWCRIVETLNASVAENEKKVFSCLYEINVLATRKILFLDIYKRPILIYKAL